MAIIFNDKKRYKEGRCIKFSHGLSKATVASKRQAKGPARLAVSSLFVRISEVKYPDVISSGCGSENPQTAKCPVVLLPLRKFEFLKTRLASEVVNPLDTITEFTSAAFGVDGCPERLAHPCAIFVWCNEPFSSRQTLLELDVNSPQDVPDRNIAS